MRSYKIQFTSGWPITRMTGVYNEGHRPYWKLDTAYEVVADQARVVVPVGFETDYASIPRPFWIKFPPADPLYGPPAILHDFLCSNAILPWDVNADIFLSAMKYMQVPPIKRAVMYAAVRCAGLWHPYANIDEILGFRHQCGIANLYNFPIYKTVEELSSFAKQQKMSWVVPA
jgi:hypothetical protein